MLWAVLALVAVSAAVLVVLALLLWRLYREIREFGRVLGRAGTEFGQMASALERASGELSERRGVDWSKPTPKGRE